MNLALCDINGATRPVINNSGALIVQLHPRWWLEKLKQQWQLCVGKKPKQIKELHTGQLATIKSLATDIRCHLH